MGSKQKEREEGGGGLKQWAANRKGAKAAGGFVGPVGAGLTVGQIPTPYLLCWHALKTLLEMECYAFEESDRGYCLYRPLSFYILAMTAKRLVPPAHEQEYIVRPSVDLLHLMV